MFVDPDMSVDGVAVGDIRNHRVLFCPCTICGSVAELRHMQQDLSTDCQCYEPIGKMHQDGNLCGEGKCLEVLYNLLLALTAIDSRSRLCITAEMQRVQRHGYVRCAHRHRIRHGKQPYYSVPAMECYTD